MLYVLVLPSPVLMTPCPHSQVQNNLQWQLACILQGKSHSAIELVLVCNSCCLPAQDEDVHASLADIALVPAGQATIALEVIAMAAMLPFLYIEVASAAEYGRSWFDIQNLIDACTYINQARPPAGSPTTTCQHRQT